jgi:signal transduction histidine kinase
MLRRLTLSQKLLFIILPLFLLAMLFSRMVNNYFQKEEALRQARHSAQTYAELVRESLVEMMVTKEQIDDSYLDRLSLLGDMKNLHVCFLPDSLHLRAFLQSPERTDRLKDRALRFAHKVDYAEPTFGEGKASWKESSTRFEAIIPFQATKKCQQCHNVPLGYVLGAAHMEIPLTGLQKALSRNWERSLFIILFFATLVSVATMFIFNRFLTERVSKLAEATEHYARGELDYPAPGAEERDELGILARAFNSMRLKLKQVQEEKIRAERLATVGQLASSIIHDFRSPMTAIRLSIDSLRELSHAPREQLERYYKQIVKSVDRLLAMAQELLDYTRGDLKLELKEWDISSLLEELRVDFDLLSAERNVRFIVERVTSGVVKIDRDRFERALLNIINNALEAMSDGGELRLSAIRSDGELQIDISDNGPGIPPEIQAGVFEPFVSAGKKRGTGLGLAITKRIVQQHQGDISFHSEPGKGTTFIIRLPLVRSAIPQER